MRSCRCVPSSLCFCQFICLSWIISSSLSGLSCCTSSTSCYFTAAVLLQPQVTLFLRSYTLLKRHRAKRHLLQLVGPGHTGMSGPAFGICICPETVRNAHTGTSSPDQLGTYWPLRVSRLIIWETWRIAPIGLVLY